MALSFTITLPLDIVRQIRDGTHVDNIRYAEVVTAIANGLEQLPSATFRTGNVELPWNFTLNNVQQVWQTGVVSLPEEVLDMAAAAAACEMECDGAHIPFLGFGGNSGDGWSERAFSDGPAEDFYRVGRKT